jgi:hypothetical protein
MIIIYRREIESLVESIYIYTIGVQIAGWRAVLMSGLLVRFQMGVCGRYIMSVSADFPREEAIFIPIQTVSCGSIDRKNT